MVETKVEGGVGDEETEDGDEVIETKEGPVEVGVLPVEVLLDIILVIVIAPVVPWVVMVVLAGSAAPVPTSFSAILKVFDCAIISVILPGFTNTMLKFGPGITSGKVKVAACCAVPTLLTRAKLLRNVGFASSIVKMVGSVSRLLELQTMVFVALPLRTFVWMVIVPETMEVNARRAEVILVIENIL